MENGKIHAILEHGADALGVKLPPEAYDSFEKYYELLEKHGRNVNLTAITGAEDVTRLHFLDSIALLKTADFSNAKVIDIGSGAGFPGIPLKIAEPSIDLTLLDATSKRIAFLSEACTSLGISARSLHARAEEAAHMADMRGRFDIAVSRAVAQLNVLCELCIPYVRVGGMFIAMKSVDCIAELDEARDIMAILGADSAEIYDYTIPGTDVTHRAILIRKTSDTPANYPRRFSKIKKSHISN